jgi:hypothetical protein
MIRVPRRVAAGLFAAARFVAAAAIRIALYLLAITFADVPIF